MVQANLQITDFSFQKVPPSQKMWFVFIENKNMQILHLDTENAIVWQGCIKTMIDISNPCRDKEAQGISLQQSCSSTCQLSWWNLWGMRLGVEDGQLLIICQHREVLSLWEQGCWLLSFARFQIKPITQHAWHLGEGNKTFITDLSRYQFYSFWPWTETFWFILTSIF